MTALVVRLWVWLAWFLVVATVVVWPLSALTFARREPQTVLALSWLAILLGSLGVLVTAQMQKRVVLDDDGAAHGDTSDVRRDG